MDAVIIPANMIFPINYFSLLPVKFFQNTLK